MIDEKERRTAERIRLALRVADAAADEDRLLESGEAIPCGLGDERCAVCCAREAYRAFVDAGRPKAKGKKRKASGPKGRK